VGCGRGVRGREIGMGRGGGGGGGGVGRVVGSGSGGERGESLKEGRRG